MEVNGEVVGSIKQGLLLLVGFNTTDTLSEVEVVAKKVVNLRVFPSNSPSSHFDLSVVELGFSVLVVSQFTLYADMRKGRRPSFVSSASGKYAMPLYEGFISRLENEGLVVQKGVFGADMDVTLTNWGPATFNLDSDLAKR